MSIAASSDLWLPEDPSDLLTVTVDPSCSISELQNTLLLNQAADDWLKGKIPADVYFDMLAQFGIDPIEFVGEVWEHLELLTRYG